MFLLNPMKFQRLTFKFSSRCAIIGAMLIGSMVGLSEGNPRLDKKIPLPQVPSPAGFLQEEQLTYSIRLFSIPAGTAKMEVRTAPLHEGQRAVKLVTRATSNKIVSMIFPVDNRVESLVRVDRMLPIQMRFQRREGSRHEDFDVVFHREKKMVSIVKDGKPTERSIPPNIHDPLSCLYFLRSLPSLEPGKSVQIQIHHDKKNYDVEVRVEAIESLSGSWGELETIRVLAVMPFRGIFLNEGNIRIWLTNDNYRVPVMMKAKVIVGSAVAVLNALPTELANNS